ncbi:MAG: hypothetical protein J1E64_08780 [Acetatifactor sp.]|nr:hypothetical protein [Acetatifactor sp.]
MIKMIELIITSSVLIAAVLIISSVMEKRIDPCLKYALWLLVAVKLLVPIPRFESNISVMNAANEIRESKVSYLFVDNGAAEDDNDANAANNHIQVGGSGTENEMHAGEQIPNDSEMSAITAPGMKLAVIWYGVWIVGVILCAGVFLWSNRRFSKQLKKNRVLVGRMKDSINIYKVAGNTGSCLFGFLKPSIYLQDGSGLLPEQEEYILAHEYSHYRHGDHVWALIRCLCVILHWYNPLVWLAARVSMKDSELACDAGTLKLIGRENYIKYGKTLIEIAKGLPERTTGISVLGCSTSAAGGMKEMRKRIKMIAKQPRTRLLSGLILLCMCVGLVGCTFGGKTDQKGTTNVPVESMEESGAIQDPPDSIPLDGEVEGKESQSLISETTNLYKQAEADKVCIRVQPSVLRDQLCYYYIPTDEDQEWLTDRIKSLDLEGEPFGRRWEGMKEKGWTVVYNDMEFRAFEQGYLYYTYTDESGDRESLIEDLKLYDYIQIMLLQELDYDSFEPAQIKDITSATLDVCSVFTDRKPYRQTIEDEETLELFADWFSHAEYIYGGVDCGNARACLTLTLAGGEVVRLSMSTDSCCNFGINGVYYNYQPASDRDNREFFECFDEIPWNW